MIVVNFALHLDHIDTPASSSSPLLPTPARSKSNPTSDSSSTCSLLDWSMRTLVSAGLPPCVSPTSMRPSVLSSLLGGYWFCFEGVLVFAFTGDSDLSDHFQWDPPPPHWCHSGWPLITPVCLPSLEFSLSESWIFQREGWLFLSK